MRFSGICAFVLAILIGVPSGSADHYIRAVPIKFNDVLGVAGFVLPGDRVDIMLTRDNYTDILLQNVKILAIDQTADERADKLSVAKAATVEVNTVDAQKLTLAQTAGSLSLALRAAGSVEAAAPRRITLCDLGPAFETYAGAKEEQTEEETAVDLLAKNVDSGFRVMETRISQMGEEFTRCGTDALQINAIPFNPNARGDFPNSPVRCDFPYGPCEKRLKPAHKWFDPG